MKKSSLVAVLAVSVCFSLLLTGCMDTVNTAENQDKSMNPNFVKNKRVVTDGYLANRIQIERVDSQFLDTGLLKVQVTMKSSRVGLWDWMVKGDEPYKIAYRFHWLNNAGMEVSTASSSWLEKDVLPGDTVWISSIAPNPQCKDFLLKLRELE